MIVHSDFLGHWKVKALANRIGLEGALTALLALWAHCERRRAWEFQLTPLMLAGICDYKGEAQVLFDTMLEVKLLERSEEDPVWVQVHEWGKVNGALVCKWVGHKGKGWFWHPRGQACKSIEGSIDPALGLTLEPPIVPAIGLDRIGEDRIGNSDLAGKPPGGVAEAGSSIPKKSKTGARSSTGTCEPAPPAKKKEGAAARRRNPLFDFMAQLTGTPLGQVTAPLAGEIGRALKVITEVCPDLSVEELQSRARAYRARFRDAELTPSALAKWWGSLGGTKKEGGAAVRFTHELDVLPDWDWEAVARELAPEQGWDVRALHEISWVELSAEHRQIIVAAYEKKEEGRAE